MSKSQETFSKKEKETKKKQKRKDKEQKKEQRQANSMKGKELEDMLAYIDENGNISSTPLDPRKVKAIKLEDIQNGVVVQTGEKPGVVRKGMVTFFNDAKGYGFIKDLQSQQSIFVHINELSGPLQERDKVTFEIEMGQKGPNAVRVSKSQ